MVLFMKKKIIVTGIILFCLVSLIVFLCVKNINKSNEQSSNSNNFKIVTSFYPMYIIAENLTQNAQNIELSNMAEVNGGCLHDYTLSTNDVKKFENADVFIENGVGIENFTEKLLQVYSNLKVIDSSTGITDIINDEEEENGHIWTSMENYKKQVKNIANNLAKYNTEIVLSYTQHYKNKFIREHAFYFISYYHGSLFNICTYWITNGKQESIETLFKIIKEFEKIKFIQKAI